MLPLIYAFWGASFTIAAAWALGMLLLRGAFPILSRSEQPPLAILTGASGLSVIVFLLCTVGLARKGVFLALGFALIALAVVLVRRAIPAKPLPALPLAWKWIFLTAFIALSAVYLLPALAPGFNPDPLTDRLSLVDHAHGFPPARSQQGFPLSGLELLCLPAFALGRHSAAVLVSAGLLILVPLLLLNFGRRIGHPVAAVLSAVLSYASPILIVRRDPAVYLALGTGATLFTLLCVIELWRRRDPIESASRHRLLIPIAVLAGFGVWAVYQPNAALPGGRALLWIAFPFLWLAAILGIARAPRFIASAATRASALSRAISTSGRKLTTAVPPRTLRFAGAALLFAYFAYWAADGLHAHFIYDDPSNIMYYWSRGWGQLIRAHFAFFTTYYRPMGGLYYLSIFDLTGFHPAPYRAVMLAIILVNIVLFFRVTKLVSGSEPVAWLAAILIAYHPHLLDMIYQDSMIYDVLCFFFYFAALAWYLGIRARGGFCNWRESAGVLVLYICALNSKEMAVTLPVTLALYELLFHPPRALAFRAARAWLIREGRILSLAALLTGLYVVGKTFGADPLIAVPAYRPEFTLHKFLQSVTANIQWIFYLPENMRAAKIEAAVAALLLLAAIARSRYLAFCVLFAITSELPIAFVGRTWSCLYIPFAAWAMLVAWAVWRCGELLARSIPRPALRVVPPLLLSAALLFFNTRLVRSETRRLKTPFLEGQSATWSAIRQFQEFTIHPAHGARIAFLNDPLPDWTTLYLTYLTFKDPSLNVYLLRMTPLSQHDVDTMDYLFDYRDGRFVQVKPPPPRGN